MRRRPGALVAPLVLLAVLLAGCSSGASGGGAAAPTPASSGLGQLDTDQAPCPEQPDRPAARSKLPGTVFDCFGGGTLDLGRAPGVPTVLNLWASWCGPCREELPLVQQLALAGGQRLRVLGVATRDGVSPAASFAKDAGITIPSAFDADGEVLSGLGVTGLPHTVFLAADGSVAFFQYGSVHSLADFEQLVAEHLGVRL